MQPCVLLCVFLLILKSSVGGNQITLRHVLEWWEKFDEIFIRDKEWDERTTKELRQNVTFNLYYSRDPKVYETARIATDPLYIHFDREKPTKIIIHGWKNNKYSEMGQNIKDAYKEAGIDANIIVVDWSDGSMRRYHRAKASVYLVADIVAEFIDRLVKECGLNVKKLHIIGHSLGAHVAGCAGRRNKYGKPARVTGLDPARPTFDKGDERIGKDSADYVDVIHTCGNRLGLSEPLGHIDYFANRGEALQRGCPKTDIYGSCSHARAYLIFAEAITHPTGFKAVKCEDWQTFRVGGCKNGTTVYIGEAIPPNYQEGSYFLKTNRDLPLALGEESLNYSKAEIREDDRDSLLAKLIFAIVL